MAYQDKKEEYNRYLNSLHSYDEIKDLTEHCWAGNDKKDWQKRRAKELLEQSDYAGILQRFDQIAYEVSYNDWERELS